MDDRQHKQIQDIRKQFLSGVSISCFSWKDILEGVKTCPEEYQKCIIDNTTNSELILRYPISIVYQKSFLKEIMKKLEEQGIEIDDIVYSNYGRLVALPAESQCYKHYIILDRVERTITLKESVNLISDGTTGLRTWQAALVLSDWALQNKEHFRNKRILELGSGVGLTGLVIFKECCPKNMYLTDCHDIVLENLKENVTLNLEDYPVCEPKMIENSRCIGSYDGANETNLSILNLPWENVNETICTQLGKLDKVIAADIIYDSDLFEVLINALQKLSKWCSVDGYIFCCTIRNPSTFEVFLEKLGNGGFSIIEKDLPFQRQFPLPTDTLVKILSFKFKLSA